jgi:hypothetical protein
MRKMRFLILCFRLYVIWYDMHTDVSLSYCRHKWPDLYQAFIEVTLIFGYYPLKWMVISVYTWTDVSQASSGWKLKVVVLVDGCLWQQFKTVDWLASTWIGRSMHSWEIDVFVSPIGNTIWRWNRGIYILVHLILQHIFIQNQLLYVAEQGLIFFLLCNQKVF